ncbi:BolA family protein [Motilimonas sp. 1_MG-2023]|uniref:BolA family protein n=1 Tax=Motilimonas TaxID=1914248 RepID=UPI0026E1CEDE|nr:BolA/IbaG family iron-sulfur metabolism protein [Motilimonas sp. 1_MG-2023]MDO6525867.1 BolA/IbaG family iron-sulfur metabolism protein [Motilimonas sp. 1_MG-2023]
MVIQEQITAKLTEAFTPVVLEVENESHKHRSDHGAESHFRVVLVSEAFTGLRLIARHRAINELLAHELANDIHALALHTFTPQEWEAKGQQANRSPACR